MNRSLSLSRHGRERFREPMGDVPPSLCVVFLVNEDPVAGINKRAFTRALQKLVPDIQVSDLEPAGSGVRAQALDTRGALLDDFCIVRSERMIHVCNVPSPAATASLVIGKQVIEYCSGALS